MKLLRYGLPGREKPGLLDAQGRIRDLSSIIDDVADNALLPDNLARLRSIDTSSLPVVSAETRLGPCVGRIGKFVCIGLNFKGHAAEQNKPWPEQPLLFAKAPSALCGPHDDIALPAEDCGPDYEVELVAVIGRRTRNVAKADALAHVAGWCVGNDVSGRRWQKSDGQFFRAKSCDTFFPCGPALVTTDEIVDHTALRLTTRIGDELLQDATAADLIHDVPTLIASLSSTMTLRPGSVILTGTPHGVGFARTPPLWLKAGDTISVELETIGTLTNPVAGE